MGFKAIDREIIKNLYKYRCLTDEQVIKLVGKHRANMSSAVPPRLINNKLIYKEINTYSDSEEAVYFLTNAGIKKYCHICNVPSSLMNLNTMKIEKGYITESGLRLKPQFLNHQISLNTFVIDLIAKLKKEQPNKPHSYYHEKNSQIYEDIRPDGVFYFNDICYFLEMDMGTETPKQLADKWENYRAFIRKQQEATERKIVVLFIVGEVSNKERRIDVIKRTVYEQILSFLGPQLDIIVDDMQGCINAVVNLSSVENELERKIERILKSMDFEVFAGNQTQLNIHEDFEYMFFAQRKDRKIHFFVDKYIKNSFYSMYKAVYMHKQNLSLKSFGCKSIVPLVLIFDSPKEAVSEMEMLRSSGIELPETVFFSTETHFDLLSRGEIEIHQLVFTLNAFGKKFIFNDLEHMLSRL